MSTHILDVSGARPFSSTVNDPAATRASVPAKQGDDVKALISGVREARLVMPAGARIERRRYVKKEVAYENGSVKKDADGETVYEENPYEELVLVVSGSVTVFGRTSTAEGIGEGWPHTHVEVKRWGDTPHFTESGELLSELTVEEWRDGLLSVAVKDERADEDA